MNFFGAIRICFVKYVDFTGRAARPEYWYFWLFVVISQICLGIVYRPLALAFELAVFLPYLGVGVRRLHDINMSGWFLLVGVIPIVGWVVIIVWLCTRGDAMANRFGDPPLGSTPILIAGT